MEQGGNSRQEGALSNQVLRISGCYGLGGGVSSCATLNLVAFNNQLYSRKILITDIKSIHMFYFIQIKIQVTKDYRIAQLFTFKL